MVLSCRNEVPNFFASTKFFSCLDLKESQELFEQTQMVRLLSLADPTERPCLLCGNRQSDRHMPDTPETSYAALHCNWVCG